MAWIPVDAEQIKSNRQKLYESYLRRGGFIIASWPILIRWKISVHRRDKRTGAVNCIPMSDYAKKQYKDAMRKWSL